MIAFRHADPRFPFLRESAPKSAGRWHAPGELTQYLCDTPDGAWAEFLRHEEIDDPQDVATIRRAIWAVNIGAEPALEPDLSLDVMTGGPESWPACQRFAQQHRAEETGMTAPSAALRRGGAHGWRVDGGTTPGPTRNGKVFALFGVRPDLVGWAATIAGRPSEELLSDVIHF